LGRCGLQDDRPANIRIVEWHEMDRFGVRGERLIFPIQLDATSKGSLPSALGLDCHLMPIRTQMPPRRGAVQWRGRSATDFHSHIHFSGADEAYERNRDMNALDRLYTYPVSAAS
jgi:hypothetical protein